MYKPFNIKTYYYKENLTKNECPRQVFEPRNGYLQKNVLQTKINAKCSSL